MATKNLSTSTAVDNKEMKREDLLQISNVYSSEFNNSSLHDRILVLKVNSEEDQIRSEGNEEGEGRKEEKQKEKTVKEKQERQVEDEDDKEEEDEEGIEKERENVKDREIEKKREEERNTAEPRKEIREVYNQTNEEETQETLKQDEERRGRESDENGIGCKETSPDKQPDEHKVFVHSSWLAVQSSYFRSLFYSGLKESHYKEVVMNIKENELQSHLTLIEAMYKLDILNDKDYSLVTEVLVLAFKYDVNFVFKKCKYVLMDTPLTLEKCEFILKRMEDLPEQDFDDLLDVLTKFLVKEFSPLDKTWTMDKFIGLSKAALRLILSSNELAVRSENTVFVALMKWIRSESVRSRQFDFSSFQHSSLLSLVRFELMSVDFLYDVVRKHPTATKMPEFSQLIQKGLAYHGFSEERRNVLKDKPVQRSSFEDYGPTFSWVIDKDVRDELLTGQKVRSSYFWYRGYKMVVDLRYEANSNSFGMFLYVQDIRVEGCLNVTWTAKSHLFMYNSFTVSHMYLNERAGWGFPEVKSRISLSTVREDQSYTIDVSVKFK